MKIEDIQRALDYYTRNHERIDSGITGTIATSIPVPELMSSPNSWKSEQLKWFLQTLKEMK